MFFIVEFLCIFILVVVAVVGFGEEDVNRGEGRGLEGRIWGSESEDLDSLFFILVVSYNICVFILKLIIFFGNFRILGFFRFMFLVCF